MKTIKYLLALVSAGTVWSSGPSVSAALYDFSTADAGLTYNGGGSSLSQLIPDNTYAGAGYSINFGDSGVNIGSLSITLNTSGGYNGDIYAYISHGGTLVQLLNPNSAVGGSGMDITLGTTGSVLPTSGVLSSGNYISYGNLSAFNNMSATGNWTVFFADLGAGDTSTLNGFNIGITAVPEPANVALAIFGGVVVLWGVGRRMKSEPAGTNNHISPRLLSGHTRANAAAHELFPLAKHQDLRVAQPPKKMRMFNAAAKAAITH